MPFFKRKPEIVEAIVWTGDNEVDISIFLGGDNSEFSITYPEKVLKVPMKTVSSTNATIKSPIVVNVGQVIIKDEKRGFIIKSLDEFNSMYEPNK